MCKSLFELITSNRARKSLRHIPKHYVERSVQAFEALKLNPVPVPEYDVKKLRGIKDTYRIRIGDIRIEYEINWEAKRIEILLVEFRRRAYR